MNKIHRQQIVGPKIERHLSECSCSVTSTPVYEEIQIFRVESCLIYTIFGYYTISGSMYDIVCIGIPSGMHAMLLQPSLAVVLPMPVR